MYACILHRVIITQVMKIDLDGNQLTSVPQSLLELPNLSELDLSHNKLIKIPDKVELSTSLAILDLSHNQLSSMPDNITAPNIHSLNLSFNKFRKVPLCICSFITLQSLDLSDNPDILNLPSEMGRLTMISQLYLNNLNDLSDPPKSLLKDPQHCIRYLNSRLRAAKEFYRMKLMLIGEANRGKTTLVKRLQGKECGNESTVGVDVSEWWYKPTWGKKTFHFSIWDFSGQQEYYATHQCFFSKRSLYLLLFNLMDGDKGLRELKPWLNNIALRAPHSCVIIIGTHLDEVPMERRKEIDTLICQVNTLTESYNSRLQIMEVIPVGLKNKIENIGVVKDSIYNNVANYKTRAGQHIMGQMIPVSYHTLDKQLETVQREARQGVREPIMHAEEFNTMVQQMNLADIQSKEELKTATLFLTDIGSLLHYDDHSHNLHELYFVYPQWLCDMMSKVVTIKEKNPFIKKGILLSKDIPLLFKDNTFPSKYFDQYLTLLDRFEIALPLDNRRILIPSMLPDERPKQLVQNIFDDTHPMYLRYIIFNSADTPPGFWSRLLSRLIHSFSKIRFALDKTTPSILIDENPRQEEERSEMMSFSISLQSDASIQTDAITTQFHESSTFTTSNHSYGVLEESTNLSSETSELDASSLLSSLPKPEISKPTIDSSELLLPNFPNSLPVEISESHDVRDIQLEYWSSGLYYKDPEVLFQIESIAKSSLIQQEKSEGNRDGILIAASYNDQGRKVIGQLVDQVISLVNEWYPGLSEDQKSSTSLNQRVPCFECIKLKHPVPYEFCVDLCFLLISNSKTAIECGYYRDQPAKNHTVSLADIVPDLLLLDIDSDFLLKHNDIHYISLLERRHNYEIYRGTYRNRPVAIKKYTINRSDEVFTELRSEAKLLLQSHHPCLVCLVGVCIHPTMALILEDAPLNSLEFSLLNRKVPVHRLTIFRIAAEVAAALRFLHNQGIIFHDLKASNVLLWSLDPTSLCHCKITKFGITTNRAGVCGLQGNKGFIAPEVMHIGKRKQESVYDHKADIFSFAMLLYQMIARRQPYSHIPINMSIQPGTRPELQDVTIATTGYHYLTLLMKKCWEEKPQDRPKTENIIKSVCLATMQSVMGVFPISSNFSLRRAISLTPVSFTAAGITNRLQNELWVCCDGVEGVELNIYRSNTMVKVNQNHLKERQVQCISLCHDKICVGSRIGIEYSVIDVFDIATHKLVHTIPLGENTVSCITVAKDRVLVGTCEGYCFSFSNNFRKNSKPMCKYVSEHAVDGIAYTNEFIWVSHSRYIHFLNPDNLNLEGSITHSGEQSAFIGQLSTSPNNDTVIWSAHLNGALLTAWNVQSRNDYCHINTCEILLKITSEHNSVITAMVPTLDTVWVGMATGHIMIFDECNGDLLTWYQPYKNHVRFLTLIPSSGPCKTEKCMVVSGGKNFIPPVKYMGMDYERVDNMGQPLDEAGVLVIWEAYEAKTIKQIKLVEENALEFLENHYSVRQMILNGEFKDGTYISSKEEYSKVEENEDSSPYLPQPNKKCADSMKLLTDLETPEVSEEANEKELFEVMLPCSSIVSCVMCPKPPSLKVLLSELQLNASPLESDYCLEYMKVSGEVVRIQEQEHLDTYIALPSRPQLSIVRSI